MEKCKKSPINLDSLIKKLIIKQLEKATGSRLLQGIKHQEKGLRQIIIEGLLEWILNPNKTIILMYIEHSKLRQTTEPEHRTQFSARGEKVV